jgi:dTDP-4-amino-4,6-dideoxygalactose transaminase
MKKRIPLTKLWLDKDELNEIKKVLNSGFITEGNYTKKFENLIAKYTNSKFAVATTSGTTALHTAFYCMGIKGKKILISDFTFPATALAVQMAGGIPVLIDVEKETMNVSKSIVEDSLEKQIEFLCPVSLFGNPLEQKFYSLRKQGLKIIEDAATNLGTKINNKPIGSLANVTCFSFHPRKIITTGEGGMITTNNSKLFKKLKKFKFFGKTQNFTSFGTNYKMSDILAAIGISQFKKIEKLIKIRQSKAKIYDELIQKINFLEPQKKMKNSRHIYQSYVCTVTKPNSRDKIIKELARNNIESQIGTYSLHCLPAFKNCIKKGKLDNSTFLYKNTITLPLHFDLTFSEQKKICKIIQKSLH